MKRKSFLTLLGLALTSIILIVGCQFTQPNTNTALSVSAAASLKEVLEEIQPLYQKARSNINLTYNFAASGALLQQIEQGAPADIFISAAARQMDVLEQKGALVPGTRSNFANNRLAIVVPKGANKVKTVKDLKDSGIGRIAIGEIRSVPAGQYAEQTLKKLNLLDQIKPKLVYANNVRQVLAAVESGNAEAGFVYVTDAKILDKVEIATIVDDQLHSVIVYPMAVLKTSQHIDAATAFVQYLSSEEAKGILRQYGFIVP